MDLGVRTVQGKQYLDKVNATESNRLRQAKARRLNVSIALIMRASMRVSRHWGVIAILNVVFMVLHPVIAEPFVSVTTWRTGRRVFCTIKGSTRDVS